MKLNNDCIRDILLTLEETCTFDTGFIYQRKSSLAHRLTRYSHEEIIYHIRQCELSDLILGTTYYDCGDSLSITDLSPTGHEYLANIRSDTVWEKTKKVAAKVGADSQSAMIQISSQIITAIIKSQFGLP